MTTEVVTELSNKAMKNNQILTSSKLKSIMIAQCQDKMIGMLDSAKFKVFLWPSRRSFESQRNGKNLN